MNLSFKVFGFEVATLDLKLHHDVIQPVLEHSLIESGVDGMTGWWVNKMMKRRRNR